MRLRAASVLVAIITSGCGGESVAGDGAGATGGGGGVGGDGGGDGDVAPFDVVHLATGGKHACARRDDGTLWCWGDNSAGQLGDGTREDTSCPVQVTELGADVVAVDAGGFHTCAVKLDGTLWCWGMATDGQLGIGPTASLVETPQRVPGLADVASVATAYAHTCAKRRDGSVWCWGRGSGAEPARVPTPLFAAEWTGVAAGLFDSCGVQGHATLWCWDGGVSTPAQLQAMDKNVTAVALGGGDTCPIDSDGATPCWPGKEGVTRLAVGFDHACGIHDGAAWCWGNNLDGQLGVGDTRESEGPRRVSALGNDVVEVAASELSDTGCQKRCWRSFSCAQTGDGMVWCWGDNTHGQLGNGATGGYSPLPARVLAACP
jgi:alpha-tubulin suppressor-like RCC1 family protein